jgi:cytochrome c5
LIKCKYQNLSQIKETAGELRNMRWNNPITFMLVLGLLVAGCDKKPQAPPSATTPPSKTESHAQYPKPDDPKLLPGYQVFATVCSHCHIESEYAPVISSPQDWQKRLDKKGRNTMLKHAIEGYGDMSPKGGQRGKDLTDEQVVQALDYILSLLPEVP